MAARSVTSAVCASPLHAMEVAGVKLPDSVAISGSESCPFFGSVFIGRAVPATHRCPVSAIIANTIRSYI